MSSMGGRVGGMGGAMIWIGGGCVRRGSICMSVLQRRGRRSGVGVRVCAGGEVEVWEGRKGWGRFVGGAGKRETERCHATPHAAYRQTFAVAVSTPTCR